MLARCLEDLQFAQDFDLHRLLALNFNCVGYTHTIAHSKRLEKTILNLFTDIIYLQSFDFGIQFTKANNHGRSQVDQIWLIYTLLS